MYSQPRRICISSVDAVHCCLLGTRLTHKLTLMGDFVKLDMFATVQVCAEVAICHAVVCSQRFGRKVKWQCTPCCTVGEVEGTPGTAKG